ncbi:hypothetical protein JCM17380_46670 [Desulfosporosinus burensis]
MGHPVAFSICLFMICGKHILSYNGASKRDGRECDCAAIYCHELGASD